MKSEFEKGQEQEKIDRSVSKANSPKHWKKQARGVIREDQLEVWDSIVQVRLDDLYHGMELDSTIRVGKILIKQQSNSFSKARQEMDVQGHSGMSWGLVKNMVRAFCVDGEEFVKTLN